MEAHLSIDRNPVTLQYLVKTINISELHSLLQTNTFENIQTEFKPPKDGALFGYPSQNTALQCNPQLQRYFIEPQMYNARGHETSLQTQNYFPAYQPNSHFEYNYPSGANSELRQDTLFENRHKTTASENLLGPDFLNNDFLSQTIDSILLGTPLSDFEFLDSKELMSILSNESLDTNLRSTSDNNCENAEFNNNPFQRDFNVESLKSSSSDLNSNTFIEDRNFQTELKSNFEKTCNCDTCFDKFYKKDTLFKQRRIYSSEQLFQNEICDRNFSQMGNFSENKNACSKEKFFHCVVCKQTLLQTDFESHMLTHAALPIQSEVFKQKISEDHLTRQTCILNKEKTYQCEVCNQKFSKKHILIRHMLTHTGERPYQCDVCKRKFSNKLYRTQHMRTHTGEKPYQCNVCKTKFLQKGNLIRHIRKHTGEKPYACHLCLQKFSQAANLNSHMHIHTGERPFQ